MNLSTEASHNDHRYGKPSFRELNVVAKNQKKVNSSWTQEHMEILKAAAKDERVNKIFVNAAIKERGLEYLCRN